MFAALAEIVARAMEKDPENRFPARPARASRELRHWLEENANPNAPDGVPTRLALKRRARRKSGSVSGIAAGPVMGPAHRHGLAGAARRLARAGRAGGQPCRSRPCRRHARADAHARTGSGSASVAAAPVETVQWPQARPPRALYARRGQGGGRGGQALAQGNRPAREARSPPRPRRLGQCASPSAPGATSRSIGTPVGTTPPLNELTLPEGKHQIVIRNADLLPYSATISVAPGQAVNLKHKFGS